MAIYGPGYKKTCLGWFENNKGADQPVLQGSLISTFDIRFLESIISRLTTGKVSFFRLVFVADQAGLNHTFFGDPKIDFLGRGLCMTCKPSQLNT